LLFLGLIGVIYLLAFPKTKYPRPTTDYYVNDYANALMMASRRTITIEGERLFEYTEDEEDGGAQIVFATFMIDDLSEISEYDKTELFRQWKIGKNDMGLLIILFFSEDEEGFLVLEETQVEVGYRMEQYLAPSQIGAILDNTLYSDEYDWLLDMGVIHLLYELLSEIYVNIYGYASFNYDMDDYYDYLISYVPDVDDDLDPMNLIVYLLSPHSTLFEKILSVLPIALVILYGTGYGVISKAGGGSSGGHGVFKRRR